MGYCMSIFSFLFLVAAISAQLISFLTSYMYENKGNAVNVIYGALTDPTTLLDGHCGIFRRCSRFEICSWWDMNIFQKDAQWLQGVVIMAFVSSGLLALIVIFSLVSYIPRFQSRRLMVFNGIILLINALILAAIVTVYTTLNGNIKFAGNGLVYSWSYWLLYGAIGANLLTSVIFCCHVPENDLDRL